MTVIAWDGKTLAADKRADRGYGLVSTTTKIHRLGDELVAHAGDAGFARAMLQWFIEGANPDTFPDHQRDAETSCGFIVISADGVRAYDKSPYPIRYEDRIFAIGTGRDFALAAMHLGRSAREAVELASHFISGCGNGVDTLELQRPGPEWS